MPKRRDVQIGKIALQLQFITKEQLKMCINLQEEWVQKGKYAPIDKWLVRQKYITPSQSETIHEAISQPQKEPSFHDTIVDKKTTNIQKLEEKSAIKTPSQEITRVAPSRPAMSEVPLTLFSGRYEIIQELGHGGMGVVYKAYDNQTNRIVALKVLIRDHGQSVERFLREGRTIANLRHPNIVTLYDIGNEKGQYYFTMDYVEGFTVKEVLAKSRLSAKQIVDIMIKVGEGVEYAHSEGVIHRDLKPENIIIDHDQEPHIMDFGLAKSTQESTELSQSGVVLGTIQYMSPEQAEGRIRDVDVKSEVYSLGATLYEMLTGRPPFTGNSFTNILQQVLTAEPIAPHEIRQRVPLDLEYICLKAMEKDPQRRYRSTRSFVEDLRRFQQGEKIEATKKSLSRVAGEKFKKYKIVLTSILFLFIGMISVWLFLSPSAQDKRQKQVKQTSEVKPVIKIFKPHTLSVDKTIEVSASTWQIDLEGKIETNMEVADVLLQQKKITWDGQKKIFKGKLQLIYGENNIEISVLGKNGQWFRQNLKIVRLYAKDSVLFRGGIHRRGVYKTENPINLPKGVWKYPTGAKIMASPVISGDHIFFGSYNTYFHAIDKETGNLVWKLKTPGVIFSSAAISNNRVYFGCLDSHIYCLDTVTGREIWKYKTGKQVLSSPAVDRGVVYCGSHDGYCYALDAEQGKLIWKYYAGDWLLSSPALDDEKVYIGCRDHYFYAIKRKDGVLSWKFKTNGFIKSIPAIYQNSVYVGSYDGKVYCFNKETGEVKWQFSTGKMIQSSPAVALETVYIGSDSQMIYALDCQLGKLKWKYKTLGVVSSSPTIVDTTVYCSSFDGFLYAFDAVGGKLKWRAQTLSAFSSAIIDNKTLYVGSARGVVWAIR